MPHDDLCPTVYLPGEGGCRCALIARVRAEYADWVAPGQHDAVVATAEARVRADEQDTKFAQLDHAEAVAAELVEVICEQDDLIQIVGVDATNHRAAAADMRRERDAARAEAERLRSPEWEAEVRADERENGCPAMGCPVRAVRAESARLGEQYEATARAYLDEQERAEAFRAEAAKYSVEIDRMVGELSSIRMEHEAEVAALQDALEDVVNQACTVSDDYEGGSHLDSMALSAYAHGMRVLAKRGRITIEHEYGRRLIGRWIEEADRD